MGRNGASSYFFPRRKRILFLLKHRDYLYTDEDGSSYSYGCLTSGLLNSARLVADMLATLGHDVKLVQVKDNNQIDREVTIFWPDICVIEAYWVVPEKFAVLHRRHPRVIWVVRNHSSMPFLSLEGVVMDWSLRYVEYPNVILACNDSRTDAEFAFLIQMAHPEWTHAEIRKRCVLLPNYYPTSLVGRDSVEPTKRSHRVLNISCFGAIRPLKNQLIQAVAALEFAETINRPIRFHINATRIEQAAHPVLKNLRALFLEAGNVRGHRLIEHPWMKRPDFLRLCARMDLGLNVSFSETFSIGAADLTTHGVPVVTSSEIPWVNPSYYADPNNSHDIACKMRIALHNAGHAVRRNLRGLRRFSDKSQERWSDFIGNSA